MRADDVHCPICKAKPYAQCRDSHDNPMHLHHDMRRRKAYAMSRKQRRVA